MNKTNPSVDVAIATYNENLLWMKFIPPSWKTFVYCTDETRKEFPKGIKPVYLPNMGREAGQWIQHLIRNYDSLSDYTVFLQGMPFDHSAEALIKLLVTQEFPYPISYIGGMPPSKDGFFMQPFGDSLAMFQKVYGSDPVPPPIPFQVGAQFYVHKKLIRNKPKSFYKKCLEEAYNPQYQSFGHMVEGCWGSFFDWPKFV
jgi:hypothetical protein